MQVKITHLPAHLKAVPTAGQLGMLGEWKDGVPRGGYHRVVQVRWQAAHIFLEPAASFR